jgi:hypothetical protein
MSQRIVAVVAVWMTLALATRAPLQAGAYARIVDCLQMVGGFCAPGVDRNGAPIGAFAIVHPPGYDGTQPTLRVEVCVSPSFPELVRPTQRAVAKWAVLTPIVGNCGPGCPLAEDPLPRGTFHAETVILHEIGHAVGLDHPNLLFADPANGGAFVNTSYSAAHSGAPIGVMVGPDGVCGSRDDFFDDVGGTTATNVHWFREGDNDPFIIDDEVIDIDTFSRSTNTQLPAGSTWAANANHCHAFQRGLPRTQAVMYSIVGTTTVYTGIAADDANMVKMQRTGEDRIAGTADDYTMDLRWVADCAEAEIEVRFGPLPFVVPGATAVHVLPTFPSPVPPLARHYTAVPMNAAAPRITVILNDIALWDFGNLVFADGFESGDTSRWDVVTAAQGERGVAPVNLGARVQGGDHPYACPIPPPVQ